MSKVSMCAVRGVASIFQRGGGGHTGSNNIVMAFSPRNIVGCLLKKGLQRGGHGHPRTPLPSYAPLIRYNKKDGKFYARSSNKELYKSPMFTQAGLRDCAFVLFGSFVESSVLMCCLLSTDNFQLTENRAMHFG